ncbi:MAG: GHKL domain-containing protein [Tissierellia bacterium]|nr:GHKL domain-containing protein [Tissierellia bacterium]
MKKKIINVSLFVAIVLFILVNVNIHFSYYIEYQETYKNKLTETLNFLDNTLGFQNDKFEYLKRTSDAFRDIRITYIDSDNNVLYDSSDDVIGIQEHLNTEAFVDSVKTGVYNPNSYKKGLTKEVYYNSFKLADNNIIRASVEANSRFGLFLRSMPINIVIMIVIYIIASYLADITSAKVVQSVKESIDLGKKVNYKVPEFSLILSEIFEQRELSESRLKDIKQEQDTINLIIENMEEGFLMVDSNKKILLVNRSALNILNASRDVVKKNILYLTRNEFIIRTIEDALESNSNEGVVSVEDRNIKYYSNPVYMNDKVVGSILLLMDKTEQIETQKIREEFSANVSHELKTPLTSIYGFSELLNNKMVPSESDKDEMIEQIYNESKRLISLTDDIMKISKLEDDDQIMKSVVNLKDIAIEIIRSSKKAIDEKQIEVSIIGEADILANETMMWEMLMNLIENAIKYNRQNGKIVIEMHDEDKIYLKVSDTGIGIPKEKQKRIFERFYRVDESRNKKSGGTGLGLSIVKHVVKKHNGEISIESLENVGTIINITLPKIIESIG